MIRHVKFGGKFAGILEMINGLARCFTCGQLPKIDTGLGLDRVRFHQYDEKADWYYSCTINGDDTGYKVLFLG